MSAEVVFGPPRTVDEGAGELSVLDAALDAADATARRRAHTQVARGVRLAAAELARSGVPEPVAAALQERFSE